MVDWLGTIAGAGALILVIVVLFFDAFRGILRYIIALCILALFANLYASWNQPQMVWKGGLVLCWMILIVISLSPWEDEPIEILTFWLARGLPIYVCSAVGGFISLLFRSQ